MPRDVAVTVIHSGPRILLVWNAKWAAFSLPMTNRRSWESMSGPPGQLVNESWEDAAMRNVGECLGRTFNLSPQPHCVIPEYAPGRRTGAIERYNFQVFRFSVADTSLSPTIAGEWLTVDEALDPARGPISPTVRDVLVQCRNPDLPGSATFPAAGSIEAGTKNS